MIGILLVNFCFNSLVFFSCLNTLAMPTPCTDRHRYCKYWAARGDCHIKALFMIKHCERSCNLCDSTGIYEISKQILTFPFVHELTILARDRVDWAWLTLPWKAFRLPPSLLRVWMALAWLKCVRSQKHACIAFYYLLILKWEVELSANFSEVFKLLFITFKNFRSFLDFL